MRAAGRDAGANPRSKRGCARGCVLPRKVTSDLSSTSWVMRAMAEDGIVDCDWAMSALPPQNRPPNMTAGTTALLKKRTAYIRGIVFRPILFGCVVQHASDTVRGESRCTLFLLS